jgi:hypothetical protein
MTATSTIIRGDTALDTIVHGDFVTVMRRMNRAMPTVTGV